MAKKYIYLPRHVNVMLSIVPTTSVSGQRRPWSDCAFAQSNQGLRCPSNSRSLIRAFAVRKNSKVPFRTARSDSIPIFLFSAFSSYCVHYLRERNSTKGYWTFFSLSEILFHSFKSGLLGSHKLYIMVTYYICLEIIPSDWKSMIGGYIGR